MTAALDSVDGAEGTAADRSSALRVVLGVAGGVAAYKACEVLRRLRAGGADVTVVPTEAALQFVGRATFEALSGHPVATDVFTDVDRVAHVATGQQADLIVVAPATADLLARAAAGMADDLLTATLLVARAPVLMVPAMHTQMWEHPATRANVALLRGRGTIVLDPAVGRLTGADSGAGRLPEPEHIAALAELLLRRPDALPHDLTGHQVMVTAGGTREALDPVRYLSNRSSGKQGYAIALLAAARGAEVTLVSCNTGLATPPGVTVVPVTSALELAAAVDGLAPRMDAVVMAAAVADYRPRAAADSKVKKTADADSATLDLVVNPDILAGLVAQRTGQRPVIVGFAAETGDADGSVIDHGRAKLARKGCDLLVVNDVSAGHGFEVDDNSAVLLFRDGSFASTATDGENDAAGADGRAGAAAIDVPFGPKTVLAAAICDQLSRLLAALDAL